MSGVLLGKVAIVSGSAQGIGRAIAIGLANEGTKVVTNNRRPGSAGKAIFTEANLQRMNSETREWFARETTAISGDAEPSGYSLYMAA